MNFASQDMLDFWSNYLGVICNFLEQDIPFRFVGLYFGFCILGYVKLLLHINDRSS